MQWVATCMPVVHIFSPLMQPAGDAVALLAHRAGLHEGGVGAVVGLGQAEAGADLALLQPSAIALVLRVGARTP